MTKNKLIFILSFIFILLLMGGSSAQALEIKNYPPLPGLTSPSSCTGSGSDCLPVLVGYIFGLIVYLGGTIAAISFAVGAVQLIISLDNPTASSSAKDRMKGAILGLVLTLSSFIILKTINPKLTELSLPPPIMAGYGVYLTNGSELKPIPWYASDVSDENQIPAGFNQIKYICDSGSNLLVWAFPQKNFTGSDGAYAGVSIQRIGCGSQAGISGQSFKLAFETPGVYYCLDGCSGDLCSGFMSGVHTNNDENISDPFNGNTKGVLIVNNPTERIYYGALFHEQPGTNSAGRCTDPFITGTTRCMSVSASNYTAAADIFQVNIDTIKSGDGVTFYSEPHGWDTGQQAGYYKLTGSSIISLKEFRLPVNNIKFEWENVVVPAEYMKTHQTFQDSPGSIEIKGGYLVSLYSKDPTGGGGRYCSTFRNNASNLKAEPIIAAGGGKTDLESVSIVPIK